MGGDAEGFALALIDQYEEAGWPNWQDTIEGTGDDAHIICSLHSIVKSRFTHGNRPELMLKKLHECKQQIQVESAYKKGEAREVCEGNQY